MMVSGVPHAVAVRGTGVLRYGSTYACERLESAIDAHPADAAEADRAPLPDDTWVYWKDAEAWAPIEPVKGLRVRFRRVMSLERPGQAINWTAVDEIYTDPPQKGLPR